MRTAPYPVLHDTAHRRVGDTTFVVRRRHFKGQNEDFLSVNITLGTSRHFKRSHTRQSAHLLGTQGKGTAVCEKLSIEDRAALQ